MEEQIDDKDRQERAQKQTGLDVVDVVDVSVRWGFVTDGVTEMLAVCEKSPRRTVISVTPSPSAVTSPNRPSAVTIATPGSDDDHCRPASASGGAGDPSDSIADAASNAFPVG